MGAVTLTRRTKELVDELLPLWQVETRMETAGAIIAHAAVDALLDLRAIATEFDELDVAERTSA